MLTYRKSDELEIIKYSDSDFSGCRANRKSIFGYVFLLVREQHLEECQAVTRCLYHHKGKGFYVS